MQELQILKEKMISCRDCSLCESRTQVVFGEGNSNKPLLMIVGQNPGKDEDLTGKPFVGACGQKLSKILDYIGTKKDNIYITNACLCLSPNNREPLLEEIKACRWRLHLEISLIKPQLLVLLGRSAMISMIGNDFKGPLKQFFSDKWMEFNIDGHKFNSIISYHISWILRSGKRGIETVLPHWDRIKEFLKNARI